MNRKYRAGVLVFLFLFVLCGCSRNEKEDETGYQIYYNTPGGTQLQTSSYVPQAENFEEIMEELAGQLAQAPAGLESVLKDGVKIQGYERGIDALRIDFSSEYYDLDNVDEVLLRAAVVKTFSQVPGVTGVMITVDHQQLVDEEGNPVPAMDREDFINTKEGGINSYQYATLSLYFVDSVSGKLRKEMRNFHYSSNMVLENVVTEQLIQGPEDSGLQPVFLDTLKILSVHVQDGICTIDFDSAVNQRPAESTADARTALYALVNSICDTCDDVEGVRIRIGGKSDTVFRDEIPLNQVFYMEMSEVEDYTEAADSAAVFAALETETSGQGNENAFEETDSGTDVLTGADSAGDTQQVSATSQSSTGQSVSAGDGSESDGTGTAASGQSDDGSAGQPSEENGKSGADTVSADVQSDEDGSSQMTDQAGSDASSGQKEEGTASKSKSSGGMVGVDPALSGE